MADFLLIKAAGEGNLEEVRRLLGEGGDANEESEAGFTPLIHAAWDGCYEIASLLIEYGARINHQTKGRLTALHCAAARNHISIVSLLVEKGADLEIKTNGGNTPLMRAASHGCYSIVSLPLKDGADPSMMNSGGRTALDLAKMRNKSDCVGILENYQHFYRYRVTWLSFSTSLRFFQDNQNQESKQIESQIQSPSLMRMMDSSDLVRYITEYM